GYRQAVPDPRSTDRLEFGFQSPHQRARYRPHDPRAGAARRAFPARSRRSCARAAIEYGEGVHRAKWGVQGVHGAQRRWPHRWQARESLRGVQLEGIKHAGVCSMTEIPGWPTVDRGTHFAKTLWNDTSGIILPYVTIVLVVIVGLSVLALDGAR